MKRVTVTSARKALDAVEGNSSRFERSSDQLTVWADDHDIREREEIICRQAIEWLESAGYDISRVCVCHIGYYIGIEWNYEYSYSAELARLNID